jgi:putative iron-regulated protein
MKKLVLTLALAAALNAPLAPAAEIDVRPVLNHYAELVHANYSDALNSARDLRTAIDAFLASPSADVPADRSERLAHGPRVLWPDRGLPLLRRADR